MWYAEHLEYIWLIYLVPAALSWYFYFKPIGTQEFTWLVVALMAGIYYWVKRRLRRFCYDTILKKSASFTRLPQISSATSEDLLDSFDIEIFNTLDELREEKDDYLKVLPALSDLMSGQEIIDRLGKLRSLGMIRVHPSRVTLTPTGKDVISAPFIAIRAFVPSRFSSTLARAQIELEQRNFNGVVDTINILFEDILRTAIESKLSKDLASTWKELLTRGSVNVPYDRASLGVLLSASRHIGLISRGSVPDNLLGTFLKLRTPEKHFTGMETDVEKDARSSLDLARIFIRYWFKG